MWLRGIVKRHINMHAATQALSRPGGARRRTSTRSNRPNESKTDALREMGGCVINCCLSPPTDNDGLYPGEFAGNRFYLEGLFIVSHWRGGVFRIVRV